jgi:hypothetical protein
MQATRSGGGDNLTVNSVTVGEVHTGLLHHSSGVSASVAQTLVDVVLGERVTRSERPISHVASPPTLTGVDCHLPSANGARVHGVGTVRAWSSITGGHILQAVACTTVHRGGSDRRLPWSYYLARPGQLHTLNRVRMEQVTTGFLDTPARPGQLDLHAIARRFVDVIQDRPGLDRRAALRASRTHVRFAIPSGATDADPSMVVALTIVNGNERTLRVTGLTHDQIPAAIDFCADLARHDWLLTTLLTVVERSRIGTVARPALIERLTPALDHLLHLWMPGAHTDEALADLWRALEGRPGFSRQWQVNVDRIRDQIALGLLEKLGAPQKVGAGADGQ